MTGAMLDGVVGMDHRKTSLKANIKLEKKKKNCPFSSLKNQMLHFLFLFAKHTSLLCYQTWNIEGGSTITKKL